jgi:NAD(P)-dependent dehydrogenase (short-subunit alcohol dehydrogenase family)
MICIPCYRSIERFAAKFSHQLHKENQMYAITGITGQVGSELGKQLLAAGLPVRAVVRDAAKGQTWAAHGAEVALADINDADALTHAFAGAEAVFVLLPPTFDPSAGFPEARRSIAACFSRLLGREVSARAVPRDTWAELFAAQGMANPTPRMHMLDGFNEGWIEFEKGEGGSRKGAVTLDQAIAGLLTRM